MRRLILGFVGSLALVPSAHAASQLFGRTIEATPPPDAGEYARRRAEFEAGLAANGLVLDGDQIVPDPDLVAPLDPLAAWEDPPHYATIFLNFFGGQLNGGTNAAEMQAGCVQGGPVEYPAFVGTESFALTVIQVFQNAMAPYAVRIAYEEAPPQHLPYSMVMMGGHAADLGMGAGILGVSCSSDCGDQWWRDTTFAFTEESSSALTLGNTALQEAAHAFGLDHIDGTDHIMYPYATSGMKVWAEGCTAYDPATGGINCTYVHDAFCGPDAGMQNDVAELMAFFGPNEPDVSPPVVSISEPADGTMLPAPADVAVAFEVTDDHEGAGWRLVVEPDGGDPVYQNAYKFETSYNLADLPQGVYKIRVEAIDHDRNEGMDEVTIYIGVDAPATTGADTGSSGGGDNGSNVTASDSGSASDTTGGDTTGPMETDGGVDRGCACTSTSPSAAALFGLLLAALAPRRRRAAA